LLQWLVVLRRISCLGLFGAVLLAPLPGSAQSAVLLAVADATQLSELRVAKVMADDSSLWLSVRLQGRTRLALVTERTSIESAPAADAWLRALDFATRVRVAAPPGPLAGCASRMPFALADSGLPEPGRVAALEVSSASSELELRRVLQDAELPVDVSRVAQFASDAQPPFQVAIYDAPVLGGSTETLRLIDHGHPLELPRVQLSGAKTLAISLIALAKEGVLPLERESADASEFPVAYRALDASSDYLSARSGWLAQNPTRWLNEVQASAALFAGAVLPLGEPISPAISRYFAQLSGASTGGCEAQIQAARARASLNTADFACGGADDLSHSLSEVDFADLRLSRFWGMASAEGMKFRVAPSVPRSPILLATDFDASGCPTQVSQPVNGASGAPDSRTPPPVSTPVVRAPDDPYYYPTPVTATEGSSTVTVINSGSNDSCGGDSRSSKSSNDSCSGDSSSSDSGDDSCSGDSSSSDSSGDSCSGDSSSSDSGDDSCSGDSSSHDSDPDSCSGDSSDSKSDSCSGDSDSSSDSSSAGDMCSGNSGTRNSARKSAALRSAKARPRQVRLSLLTLLAAALALPLRRLRASR
jgi:hypothetical protein